MKKILKSRYLIASLCTILAAILAFAVLPRLYKYESSTTQIIKTNKDIAKGTLITEDDLTTVTVGVVGLPHGVITDKQQIVGKYAAVDISRHDLLFESKFTEDLQEAGKGLMLADDEKLISLTLSSAAAAVAGHVKAGSIVDIACYIPEKTTTITDPETLAPIVLRTPETVLIPDELKGIKVYSMENSRLQNLDSGDPDITDMVPAVITLIVKQEQEQRLIEFENIGKIHLIKRG